MASSEWHRRLAVVIGALAESFRQKITPATIKGYEMGLDDLPIEAVERAARIAIRQCEFMPTAQKLRELAGELRPEQRASLAWAAMLKALAQHGPYRAVDFDDPALNATVRAMGGWPQVDQLLGETSAEKTEGIIRKRFEQTYCAILARGISPEAARPLSGLSQIPRAPELVACELPRLPADRFLKLPQAEKEILALPAIGVTPVSED